MVSFGGGRPAEFKRPSQKDPSFLGNEPIVLHRSFGTCALVIIPPPNYRDTSDRVTLLVFTISEDIIVLRRRRKIICRFLRIYTLRKYKSETYLYVYISVLCISVIRYIYTCKQDCLEKINHVRLFKTASNRNVLNIVKLVALINVLFSFNFR